MPVNVEQTPPPRIGKIGPYTVFITPPATPTATTTNGSEPLSNSPKSVSSNSPKKATPGFSSPRTPVQVPVQSPPPPPPPVQAPPSQFYPTKPPAKPHSSFGFFWDAVAKVQNAHTSLDEHVAYWFGLNQSKYQWALDDYYESKGTSPTDMKANGVSGKVQNRVQNV